VGLNENPIRSDKFDFEVFEVGWRGMFGGLVFRLVWLFLILCFAL
jgi:hypothetical protein